MKPAKQFLFLVAALFGCTATMQAQQYFKLNSGSASTTTYEASGGKVGIGLTTPSTKLEVRSTSGTTFSTSYHSVSPAPDHYLARHYTTGGPPNYTVTEYPDFIIKGDGKTGIGTASPSAWLTVTGKQEVTAPNMEKLTVWQNKNGYDVATLANVSTTTTNGGFFYVIGSPNNTQAALAVANVNLQITPFSVYGGGTVAMGHSFAAGSPTTAVAQLDVRVNNPYSHVFNVGNYSDLSGTFLNVSNNGPVGIGVVAQSGVALTVKGFSTNAKLDLVSTAQSPAFLRFSAGSTTIRHQITEANGDLVIDPGVSGGGANDMVKIDGKLKVGNYQVTSGTHSDAKLFVDGKIAAKSCIITVNNWADDVFNDNYNLMDLSNLKKFVITNKHLPGIPTEAEVLSEGVSLGESNVQLLRKTEELTLYIIALQDQLSALQKRVETLTHN